MGKSRNTKERHSTYWLLYLLFERYHGGEAGIAPRTLQDIMGHASMKMTMELYNHVTDERLTNEIQKLNSSKNMHFFKFNKNSQKKQITS